MLRIKLQRAGKKNQPFFRMVVIEKKTPPKGGRPVEVVGFYNPLTKENGLKEERINYWLSVGAQPSDVVHNMLVAAGVIKGEKIDVHKKAKAGGEELPKPEAETQGEAVEQSSDKQEREAEKADASEPEKESQKQAKQETKEEIEEEKAEGPAAEPEKKEEPKPEEKEEAVGDEAQKIVDKKE